MINNLNNSLSLVLEKKKNILIKLKESNINEFGRFDDLVESVDKVKAKEYFEKLENTTIPQFKVNIKVHNLLQEFILKDGIDIE